VPIKFVCPLCRHRVKVSRKDAGTRRGCPACNETIAVPALKTEPAVEEWDENSDKEPPKEPGRATAKLIKQFAADAAPMEARELPPPAAKKLPSAGRVPRPPVLDGPASEASRRNTAIAVLVGVGVFVVGGVVFLFLPKPPPKPDAKPDLPPVVVTPEVKPETETKKDPELEAAYARVIEARELENHGDELKAEELFDREIEASRSTEARRTLIAGRRAFLDRCRTTLLQVVADVKYKALNGKTAEAQTLINDHYQHVPRALHEELFHEVDALNEELLARLPNEKPRMRAARKATPTEQGAPDERGRFERLEEALHDAVLALDGAAARKAIDDAGRFATPELAQAAERQGTCARAAIDVALLCRDGIEKSKGESVTFGLWRGSASGKLARLDGNVLVLELVGGGTREVGLAELSAATLASYVKPGTPETAEMTQFGLGVLCLVHGDLAGARERLAAAPSIETAAWLARSLEKDAPATPKATSPTSTTPEPVAQKPGSGDVTERWPNGNPKKHYSRDEKGRLVGLCTEYTEDGKPRTKSHYQLGELEGEYVELYPNGKPAMKATYRKGKLSGDVLYYNEAGKLTQRTSFTDGKLLASKTPDEIRRDLDAIMAEKIAVPQKPASPSEFTPLEWDQQARALRRLRAYRYLCGVPHDVDLSWEYAERCTAAALLLEYVGKLEHTPAQPPGCPDLLYKVGYTGTSNSNLHQNTGGTNALESVDGFMEDAGDNNVERVGHRRWCLNPKMALTAFGVHGQFAAMYALDEGRNAKADRVAYPAAGFFPSDYIKQNALWSVSFDAARYRAPGSGELQVVVSPADEKYRKLAPVALEDVRINAENMGMPLCLIFRPKTSYAPGRRYWVEIRGFKAGGEDQPIEYFVEFF